MNRFGESPTFGTFPLFRDERGGLGVCEFGTMPFEPKRMFWIFDSTPGYTRANHGHRECRQLIFSQSGTTTGYVVDASGDRVEFMLEPGDWVDVPVRHWVQISTVSAGGVVGVWASHPFDPAEYIDEVADLDTPG